MPSLPNGAYLTVQYATPPPVLFDVPCKERGGVHLRAVREMPKEVDWAVMVAAQMTAVRNFLGSHDSRVFLDPDCHFFLVDDIGIIGAVGIVEGLAAHIHMTFWDGRMRGRELLARSVVDYLMYMHHLGGVWTGVPREHRAVIAFARRAGFRPFYEDKQYVGLLYLRRT